MKYKNWTEIEWDGNPALKLRCFRKSFGRGHVSVGIGEFTTIVYSYGPKSDDSMSSTRWRASGTISEKEAMAQIDLFNGKYRSSRVVSLTTEPTQFAKL